MKTRIIVFAFFVCLVVYSISPVRSFKLAIASAEPGGTVSTIAGIEVGGLEGDELKRTLQDAIDQWLKEPLIVSGDGSSIDINKTTIQFDIDRTIYIYESMTKQKWYAIWQKEKVVHLPLEVAQNDGLKEELSKISSLDTEETYARVIDEVAYLKTGKVEAVVKDTSALEVERIALAIEEIPETAFGTYDIALSLNDQVVAPGETFSFIQVIGDNIDAANSEALDFVASLIYQNALNIYSEILERHSQHKVPGYLEPGIEAAINRSGKKDLQFVNRMTTPIKLKLSVEAQQLKAEIYSSGQEATVTASVVRDEEIKPRTITRYTNDLSIGQVREVQKGAQGLRVSVYRVIDGVEELVSKDYYPPVNRILLKSSRQLQTQQPTETDPDLEMDLDGDGLADVETSDEAEGKTKNEKKFEVDENGNPILPPGYYYDKGGNLITP